MLLLLRLPLLLKTRLLLLGVMLLRRQCALGVVRRLLGLLSVRLRLLLLRLALPVLLLLLLQLLFALFFLLLRRLRLSEDNLRFRGARCS